ncbi:MAG TPA: hypothetical protein VNB88_11090 [Gaiellaceae bacterium]|nr:hypothetical protein [Gaiellaceae bacterium]
MVRVAPLLALVLALTAYDAWAEHLPNVSTSWDVVFIGLVLIPATFVLLLLALPFREELTSRRLLVLVVGLAAITILLELAGADPIANQTKFVAVALLGWWFLQFFESVGLVLLVAILITPVDIFSVARGPTKHIVEQQPQVFDALSIAFPVLGESSSAQLGLPDVLFFSLFLAATARFALRTLSTWVAMALSFGTTLALAVWTDVTGLPALPLLSAGFVLVNADLIWKALRDRRDEPDPA